LKPSTRPTTSRPTTAKPKEATKGSMVGVRVAIDPTKPKAVQSEWLIYLKLSGGPFPKEVKEAKMLECKEKYDKMKVENNEEYLAL